MFSIMAHIFAMMASAVTGFFAFIKLMETGAPIMGLVLFACGICFAGAWVCIAHAFEDAKNP